MESKIFQEVTKNVRSGCDHRFRLKQRPVTLQVTIASVQNTFRKLWSIISYTNAMPGNELVYRFLRRQILGKQSVARIRNNI
jgi:hypothetical protein